MRSDGEKWRVRNERKRLLQQHSFRRLREQQLNSPPSTNQLAISTMEPSTEQVWASGRRHSSSWISSARSADRAAYAGAWSSVSPLVSPHGRWRHK